MYYYIESICIFIIFKLQTYYALVFWIQSFFCNALDFIIGATFIVKIIDCKLYVRMLKPVHHAVYIAHSKALEGGNAIYPIRRAICKTGNLDHTQENLCTGHLSTHIVIGYVDNDAFNWRYAKARTMADIPSRPPCLGDFENPGQIPIDLNLN